MSKKHVTPAKPDKEVAFSIVVRVPHDADLSLLSETFNWPEINWANEDTGEEWFGVVTSAREVEDASLIPRKPGPPPRVVWCLFRADGHLAPMFATATEPDHRAGQFHRYVLSSPAARNRRSKQ